MVTLFILVVATIKIKGACEGLLYQTSDTLISVKKVLSVSILNIIYIDTNISGYIYISL